ncbi:MAG: MBL fold metallo-hydrolase [Nanoarchaeota archaeon]|nr:MBL fold metallo-hydrolase [Nanoarchaeota archaeon]
MNIIPVCFDSMGVRSMCTFVHTDKLNILIDPGLALATKRLGYPPTNIELNTFYILKQKILDFARKSEVIIITHYHYDHYISSHDEMFEELFTDKIVLCKNRKTKLNFEQRTRGKEFEISVKKLCKEFHFIDGNTFNLGGVKIKCSEPLWHGTERSSFGYIIMLTIEAEKTKFLYSSDIMGPIESKNADYIINEGADIMVLCGPPTHLLGYDLTEAHMNQINQNVDKIIKKSKAKDIIYDHYILRDKNYMKYFKPWVNLAKKNKKKFLTAAEYAGVPIRQLEANREEIYNQEM